MTMTISEWQEKFRAGITFFATIEDGEYANFYESKEAAMTEVRWAQRHKKRALSVTSVNVHTLELAQERWERDLREEFGPTP